MTTIDATNSVFNGVGSAYSSLLGGSGASLIVASDGFLGSGSGFAAINISSFNSAATFSIQIDGMVLGSGAGSKGIFTDTGSGQVDATINIGASGLVMARGAAHGIEISFSCSITNNGSITTDGGDAIRLNSSANGSDSVVNAGTITSGGAGYAIRSLENFGVLSGIDAITNSGVINGFVSLASGNDTITNLGNGRITKSVLLGAGADQYTGSAGAFTDTVLGEGGNDTLRGNGGNDVLNGGLDSDTLFGGLGNDILTGGSGADVFVFNTALAGNIDTIADYNVAADTIRLENAFFNKIVGVNGLTAIQFFKSATATAAHDLNDRIVYNTTTGALYYDADGNKAGGVAAVKFATLTGSPDTLLQSDFFII